MPVLFFLCCRSEHWVVFYSECSGPRVYCVCVCRVTYWSYVIEELSMTPTPCFHFNHTTSPLSDLGTSPKPHWKLDSALRCGHLLWFYAVASCALFHLSKDCLLSILRDLLIHLSCSLFCVGLVPFGIPLLSFSWSQEEGGTTWVVGSPFWTGALSHARAVGASSRLMSTLVSSEGHNSTEECHM